MAKTFFSFESGEDEVLSGLKCFSLEMIPLNTPLSQGGDTE